VTGAVTDLRELHVVMPGRVSDPTAPSGGDVYDRRVCRGLAAAGWSVRERAVPGAWPRPGPAGRAALADALAAIPERGVVLLDGLVAAAAPEVVVPASRRLRPVVLVHLPLGDETGLPPAEAAKLTARERRTLRAAAAVVATSAWAARRLVRLHELPADRVHVAAPGVEAAPPAPGTDGASQLLCVAALTPLKGQHVLVEALARVADLPWRCTCVGGWDRAPGYAARVRRLVRAHRLDDRLRLVGPRTGADLAASYAAADLVVLASRMETYGMVVTEALARGVPVAATDVGGVPEALGHAPGGDRPGLLVPPADPPALAGALRRWFEEPDTRRRLRRAARARRPTLAGWDATVRALTGVLERLDPDDRRAQ
jgi:glycosyltransferase involved in cell wall biosynthesis